MAQVLIVGGGLIGLLTARALRARGFAVTVLERGAPGRESSWAGGGILSPLYPWRFPAAVTALASAGQREWPRLAEDLHARTGVDPEYRRSGMLVVDTDDPQEVAAWARRYGVALEQPDTAAIARREPALAVPAGNGFDLPAVAQVRNPPLLRALTAVAVGEGVELRGDVEVDRIATGGRRVRGVHAGGRLIGGDHVIVCAGAWSAGLVSGLGAEPPPIQPVRGQMLMFDAPAGLLGRIVLSGNHYLIPRADGRILAGSTVEAVGFDKRTTEAARGELEAFATGLLPALAEAPVAAHWAGLRPGSADGVPTIAAHPRVAGLWLNAGHFRNGIVTAPASAALLASLVAGEPPALDPRPCAWPPDAADG